MWGWVFWRTLCASTPSGWRCLLEYMISQVLSSLLLQSASIMVNGTDFWFFCRFMIFFSNYSSRSKSVYLWYVTLLLASLNKKNFTLIKFVPINYSLSSTEIFSLNVLCISTYIVLSVKSVKYDYRSTNVRLTYFDIKIMNISLLWIFSYLNWNMLPLFLFSCKCSTFILLNMIGIF